MCWYVSRLFEKKSSINLLRCWTLLSHILDVDECFPGLIPEEYRDLSHNCHADANCSNTKGSFFCTCHIGYSGDGVNCTGNSLVNFFFLLSTIAIRFKFIIKQNKAHVE